jgi:uncharacterized protein YqgQ
VSILKVETHGLLDAQDIAIRKLMKRQDDVEMVRGEMDKMFSYRDA